MHFNSIEDLYLIRIFDNESYLDAFVSGTCFRMNSVEKFRKIENEFQGDVNECRIILNAENKNAKVFIGDAFPKKQIGDVKITDLKLNGYIYCFFAIPKNFFYIENNEIMMDDDSPYYKDFITSLSLYYKNCSTKKCFIAVLDAKELIQRFSDKFKKSNYKYGYGFVNYKNINTNDRLEYIAENILYKIIFEKDIKYSYQHEFRFYIAADIKKEYLEIRDINLSDIQRIKFELNPDSLKSLKI